MGAEHTPGPWVWENDPRANSTKLPALRGAGGVVVCAFGDWEQYYPSAGIEPDEADAHLIAAAPDLLEALERAEAKMFALGREFCGPRFTDRHGDGPQLLQLAEQARAAIAKARASSPAPSSTKGGEDGR